MKHHTSEIAIAAVTAMALILLFVVPGPGSPWPNLILAALIGTLSFGVLISLRRQIVGVQRKLSPEGLERAVNRLQASQDEACERLEARLADVESDRKLSLESLERSVGRLQASQDEACGRVEARLAEVESDLERVHAYQYSAERSRAKADLKTHERLGVVRNDIRSGFAGELADKLRGLAEALQNVEAKLGTVESLGSAHEQARIHSDVETHERLEKILLTQNSMERSRARSVTKTHELARRNESEIRETLRRLSSVEDDLRSLGGSTKALRDLLVEASVTLDMLMSTSDKEELVSG